MNGTPLPVPRRPDALLLVQQDGDGMRYFSTGVATLVMMMAADRRAALEASARRKETARHRGAGLGCFGPLPRASQ